MNGVGGTRVEFDDGTTVDLTIGTRDVLMWEKTVKGATAQKLGMGRLVDIYALTWSAGRRQGLWALTLEEFESTAEIVKATVAETDPTNPAV